MSPISVPPPPVVITASTAGLGSHDKFDYWHDVVCRTVVDLECGPLGREPFEASVNGVLLEGLSLSRIRATAHEVSRLAKGIASADSDALIFNFLVCGHGLAQQDGRSVLIQAGDGALCDAQRPYSLRFDGPFEVLAVKVPRASLPHRTASLQRVTARSLAHSGQMCPIVFGYLSGFSQQASSLGTGASAKVSRNFAELLGAALDEVILSSPVPLSEYRGVALIRVKEFVESRLRDCDLDPALVAAALQLSPRYINKLFEAEGTSLSRFIWRRRIERAAADLRDPVLHSHGISLIAMSYGFNDLSHFSRVFRQRYGVSPRGYRSGEA